MNGASRWLDATPRRTAPATRPAPIPIRTSNFLVMQAPFDDRFYGAREETDVRVGRRSGWLVATFNQEDTKNTRDARRTYPPQRIGGRGGQDRSVSAERALQ